MLYIKDNLKLALKQSLKDKKSSTKPSSTSSTATSVMPKLSYPPNRLVKLFAKISSIKQSKGDIDTYVSKVSNCTTNHLCKISSFNRVVQSYSFLSVLI
jgi:hypothetical protein